MSKSKGTKGTRKRSRGAAGAKRSRGAAGRSRGTGQLTGYQRDLIPASSGLLLTGGTTLGIRAFVNPSPEGEPYDKTAGKVYRWAPLIGVGSGLLLGSGVMYALYGAGPAWAAGVSSVVLGGSHMAMEALHTDKPGAFKALSAPMTNGNGTSGLGAAVPEYQGMSGARSQGTGAIVMEELEGGRGQGQGTQGLGANEQNQGEVLNLRGVVDTGAFGHQAHM